MTRAARQRLVLALAMVACACSSRTGEEERIGESSAAVTCNAQLAVFPVRGKHNTGYDVTAGNSSLWTCDADNSNSDYNSNHLGNDIWAAEGTPVAATVNGTFRYVEANNSYSGNKVTIVDDCGWYHFYAHLQGFGPGVSSASNGKRATAGQIIGYVGSTGTSSNGVVHLHYSIYPDDDYYSGVNPHPFLRAVESNVCGTTPPPSTDAGRVDAAADANVSDSATNPDVSAPDKLDPPGRTPYDASTRRPDTGDHLDHGDEFQDTSGCSVGSRPAGVGFEWAFGLAGALAVACARRRATSSLSRT